MPEEEPPKPLTDPNAAQFFAEDEENLEGAHLAVEAARRNFEKAEKHKVDIEGVIAISLRTAEKLTENPPEGKSMDEYLASLQASLAKHAISLKEAEKDLEEKRVALEGALSDLEDIKQSLV